MAAMSVATLRMLDMASMLRNLVETMKRHPGGASQGAGPRRGPLTKC